MEVLERIGINASAQRIWTILTENNYVKQYMFGCSIDSSWEKNTDINYYMINEEERVDMVLGKIVQIIPPNLLHHTLFPANADYPNIPENHIYVLYTIEEKGNTSVLTIKQGGFDTAAEGEKRFESARQGWDIILGQIKTLAEEIPT